MGVSNVDSRFLFRVNQIKELGKPILFAKQQALGPLWPTAHHAEMPTAQGRDRLLGDDLEFLGWQRRKSQGQQAKTDSDGLVRVNLSI
jgi:hypothetical protein